MIPAAESRFRVRYAETDAMGIVHHASYLVWFEVGRTDLLRRLGIPYAQLEAQGVQSPVVEISARYRQSAHYDEAIRVDTRLAEVGAATIRFEYQVYREGEAAVAGDAGGVEAEPTLLVTGTSLHCFLDGRGRPMALRKLPEPTAGRLAAIAAELPQRQ